VDTENELSEQEQRARNFLEEQGTIEFETNPEARLQWAQNDRQLVTNTLQVYQQRYRVASIVNDEREKNEIRKKVEDLLFKMDEWDKLIAELEATIRESK
jgi:hypothetical protein